MVPGGLLGALKAGRGGEVVARVGVARTEYITDKVDPKEHPMIIIYALLALLKRATGVPATTKRVTQVMVSIRENTDLYVEESDGFVAVSKERIAALRSVPVGTGSEEEQRAAATRVFPYEMELATREHMLSVLKVQGDIMLDKRFLDYACRQLSHEPNLTTSDIITRFASAHDCEVTCRTYLDLHTLIRG